MRERVRKAFEIPENINELTEDELDEWDDLIYDMIVHGLELELDDK